MSAERIDETLLAVQSALAALRVKPPSMDRDRMMFLAGRASARPISPLARRAGEGPGVRAAHWLWPLATTASLLIAAILGGMLLLGAKPQTYDRVVYVPVDRPIESTVSETAPPVITVDSPEPPIRGDYLALRRLVLTEGVDAMPMPAANGPASPEAKPFTPRDAYGGAIDHDGSG
jgi:hypothetical protein